MRILLLVVDLEQIKTIDYNTSKTVQRFAIFDRTRSFEVCEKLLSDVICIFFSDLESFNGL